MKVLILFETKERNWKIFSLSEKLVKENTSSTSVKNFLRGISAE